MGFPSDPLYLPDNGCVTELNVRRKLCHFVTFGQLVFRMSRLFHHHMSTFGSSSKSIPAVSRWGRAALRTSVEPLRSLGRIHTGRVCRQEPKQKDSDNEPWAMPSPSSVAGPSRLPLDASSDALNSKVPPTSTSATSTIIDTPKSSTSVSALPSSPKSPKSPNRLPQWIPPHWQTQLQPDAQWRKELLIRRKKLAEQAGQQLTGLGLKLNEVTGYKEVERLKELVQEKGKSSCLTMTNWNDR